MMRSVSDRISVVIARTEVMTRTLRYLYSGFLLSNHGVIILKGFGDVGNKRKRKSEGINDEEHNQKIKKGAKHEAGRKWL